MHPIMLIFFENVTTHCDTMLQPGTACSDILVFAPDGLAFGGSTTMSLVGEWCTDTGKKDSV